MVNNQKIQNAMVLAAGLGTRMKPITNSIPKPLVKVNNKALLDYALDSLAQEEVKNVSVNVHYLAEQIEQHVHSRTHPLVDISDERKKLLDSGGGVKHAIQSLKQGPFIILNSDSFWIDGSIPNLSTMTQFWNNDTMDMLLLLTAKDKAVGFDGPGDFFIDGGGRLTRRGEADSAPAVYAGAIIAKAEHFHSIEDKKFSLNVLFDAAIAKRRLFGVMLDGLWLHVGTPGAIGEAEQAIDNYCQNSS